MMIFQKTKCLCKIFKNTTKQSHSTFGAQLRFRGRPGNNNGVVVSRIYLPLLWNGWVRHHHGALRSTTTRLRSDFVQVIKESNQD